MGDNVYKLRVLMERGLNSRIYCAFNISRKAEWMERIESGEHSPHITFLWEYVENTLNTARTKKSGKKSTDEFFIINWQQKCADPTKVKTREPVEAWSRSASQRQAVHTVNKGLFLSASSILNNAAWFLYWAKNKIYTLSNAILLW